MEVVGPLGVDPEAAEVAVADDAGVVQVALGDQDEVAAEVGLEDFDLLAQLLQERDRRGVDDRVDRVEAEAIEVIVAEPHQGVVAEEPPDLVAVGAVEVERIAPGGVVAVGEIRGELRQEVARRPHVVVDYVEEHAELPCSWQALTSRFSPSGPPYSWRGAKSATPS